MKLGYITNEETQFPATLRKAAERASLVRDHNSTTGRPDLNEIEPIFELVLMKQIYFPDKMLHLNGFRLTSRRNLIDFLDKNLSWLTVFYPKVHRNQIWTFQWVSVPTDAASIIYITGSTSRVVSFSTTFFMKYA